MLTAGIIQAVLNRLKEEQKALKAKLDSVEGSIEKMTKKIDKAYADMKAM